MEKWYIWSQVLYVLFIVHFSICKMFLWNFLQSIIHEYLWFLFNLANPKNLWEGLWFIQSTSFMSVSVMLGALWPWNCGKFGMDIKAGNAMELNFLLLVFLLYILLVFLLLLYILPGKNVNFGPFWYRSADQKQILNWSIWICFWYAKSYPKRIQGRSGTGSLVGRLIKFQCNYGWN